MNERRPPESAALPGAQTLYASQGWFNREVEQLFRRHWLPAGRAAEFREIGSYRALRLFDEPIVLVRGQDRVLRALSNVCRHRFVEIAEGAGETKRLVCPYHAWSYGLDGALIGAPCMEGADDFERSSLSLRQFPVEEWEGWVFVALGSRPEPLSATLAPLAEKLSHLGLSEWVEARRLSYPAPWNWKLMVENFSESYHHFPVHKETLQPYWPANRSYGLPTNGAYAEIHHSDHADLGTFSVYTIFPYLMFAVQSRAPLLFWPSMTIRGPADMDLDMILLAAPDYAADSAVIDAHAADIDLINREDFPLLLKSQRGASSRLSSHGPLSPLEQAISLFHAYLGRAMRSPSQEPD